LTLTLSRLGRTLGFELLNAAEHGTSSLLLARAKVRKLSGVLRLRVCKLLSTDALRLRCEVLKGPSSRVCDACLPLGRSALRNGPEGCLGALQGLTLFLLGIRDTEETAERLGHEGRRDAQPSANKSTRKTAQGPAARSTLGGSGSGILHVGLALSHKTKKLVHLRLRIDWCCWLFCHDYS